MKHTVTDQSQHLTRPDAQRLGRRRLPQLGATTADAILLDRPQAVGAVASVVGADGGYVDVHTDFLTHQPDTILELQS